MYWDLRSKIGSVDSYDGGDTGYSISTRLSCFLTLSKDFLIGASLIGSKVNRKLACRLAIMHSELFIGLLLKNSQGIGIA